jgi:glycosyltransferase involved in cell wall biosynthesis
MKRPRVAIVRQSDLYEMPVRREAEALAEAGYETEVICMHNPERTRTSVVNGVKIIGLPATLSRSGKVLYAFEYLWFFTLATGVLTARHLRRRYAAVQVNSMPDFLAFSALVPKLLGSRIVVYLKEPIPELAETLYGPGRLTRALSRLEQSAIRFSDRALTVTNELKERFVERGADPDRITVVLNGASADALLADWSPPETVSKEGFTVLCHGSIEHRYGQDTLVEAAALLRDEMPDLRIVFSGRGSAVDDMLAQIDELGVGDVVDFKGWVTWSELADLLHSADVGVVGQKASAYSHLVQTNKMVDYWIFGMPVIASRLRSVSELYDDSVLEFFEPGDPESLADAIRRLRGDAERRAELARNGKRALEQNGWEVQREIYLGVYEELLNGQAGVTRRVESSSPERSA